MVTRVRDQLRPGIVSWVIEATQGEWPCKYLAFEGPSAFGRMKWGH